MKNLVFALLIIIVISSCKKEDDTPGDNNGPVDSLTLAAVDSLLYNSYLTMRAWYGKENGYVLTECGTDLYTYGSDTKTLGLADYLSFYEGETTDRLGSVWNELYRSVINCNAIIDILTGNNTMSEQELQYVAEASFLRAFYLWHIVETWGGTNYTTEWDSLSPGSFSMQPVDTFYARIFSDLAFAEAHLPVSPTSNTTLSKPVAEALLARMHLTRGNYIQAVEYAQKLIDNTSYTLVDDYEQMWEISNRQNSEVIYALDNTQYPDPLINYADLIYEYPHTWILDVTFLSMREGGNQGHLMWEIRYENLDWGLTRDVENGRGFQRFFPTLFFIDLFNQQLDQRFNGSFKNTWFCNDENAIPVWKANYYIDGVQYNTEQSKVGNPMFSLGDTAILFSKDPYPAGQRASYFADGHKSFHPEKGYMIFDINDMYDPDGAPSFESKRQFCFPITKKFMDATRLDSVQEYSSRNVYIIRLAEMFLIAAEASWQSGNTAAAYNYLISLANKRSYTSDGEGLLSNYGVDGGGDITIDFLLDERARELAAEQLRWFDLKRTGKLVQRVSANNTDAALNIQEYHNLRPIPLEFVFLRYKSDDLIQNPGY